MAAAEAMFENRKQIAGGEMGDHMKRAAKAGLKSFQAAIVVREIPGELAYLMAWYHELRQANGRGFHCEPLSFSEMIAYRDLMGVPLTHFDAWMLRRLDAVWMTNAIQD